MDQRSCIAGHIDVQMRRHLGVPLDTHRAVADARYCLDMLLVCDAMIDTELPQLARQFRVAEALHGAARRQLRVAAARPPLPEAGAMAVRPVTFGRDR